MQTSGDKHRIIDIGSPEDRTVVMGNLKFDIKNTLTSETIETYQNDFQSKDFKVIIAGSTHQGEDEVILSTFAKLKAFTPKLKLLLAPRHPERYPAVVELLSQTGLNFGYRSKNDNFLNNDIILLDTMGELGKLYSISDIAFIGGSFTKTGGHNPLEATIFNVPTLSGPCVYNFKDIYKLLVDENAAIIVNSEEELFDKTKELLSDVQIYGLYSNSCNDVFSKNSGALEFATEELKKVLD